MKNALFSILFFAACLLANEAWPPFRMPTAARDIKVDKSNRTWNMTGVIDMSPAEAEKTFRINIEAEKFIFLHEILMQASTGKKLLAWKKGQQRLILLIWKINEQTTGFAWGLADK